eukprot:EG_transcript_27217
MNPEDAQDHPEGVAKLRKVQKAFAACGLAVVAFGLLFRWSQDFCDSDWMLTPGERPCTPCPPLAYCVAGQVTDCDRGLAPSVWGCTDRVLPVAATYLIQYSPVAGVLLLVAPLLLPLKQKLA